MRSEWGHVLVCLCAVSLRRRLRLKSFWSEMETQRLPRRGVSDWDFTIPRKKYNRKPSAPSSRNSTDIEITELLCQNKWVKNKLNFCIMKCMEPKLSKTKTISDEGVELWMCCTERDKFPTNFSTKSCPRTITAVPVQDLLFGWVMSVSDTAGITSNQWSSWPCLQWDADVFLLPPVDAEVQENTASGGRETVQVVSRSFDTSLN